MLLSVVYTYPRIILMSRPADLPTQTLNTHSHHNLHDKRHRRHRTEVNLNERTASIQARAAYSSTKRTHKMGNIQEHTKAACKQEALNSPNDLRAFSGLPTRRADFLIGVAFLWAEPSWILDEGTERQSLAPRNPFAEVLTSREIFLVKSESSSMTSHPRRKGNLP